MGMSLVKRVLEMAIQGKIEVKMSKSSKHHHVLYTQKGKKDVVLAVRSTATAALLEGTRLHNKYVYGTLFQGARDTGLEVSCA